MESLEQKVNMCYTIRSDIKKKKKVENKKNSPRSVVDDNKNEDFVVEYKNEKVKLLKFYRILLEYSQLNTKYKQENFQVNVWHNNKEIHTSANDATIHNFYRKKHRCYDLYANDPQYGIPDELKEKPQFYDGYYWLFDFTDPLCIELSSDEIKRNGEICITLSQLIESKADDLSNGSSEKKTVTKANSSSTKRQWIMIGSVTLDLNNSLLNPCYFQSASNNKYSTEFRLVSTNLFNSFPSDGNMGTSSSCSSDNEDNAADATSKMHMNVSLRYVDVTLFVHMDEEEKLMEIVKRTVLTKGPKQNKLESLRNTMNGQLDATNDTKAKTTTSLKSQNVTAATASKPKGSSLKDNPIVKTHFESIIHDPNLAIKLLDTPLGRNRITYTTPAATTDVKSIIGGETSRVDNSKLAEHRALEKINLQDVMITENDSRPTHHGLGALSGKSSKLTSLWQIEKPIDSNSKPSGRSRSDTYPSQLSLKLKVKSNKVKSRRATEPIACITSNVSPIAIPALKDSITVPTEDTQTSQNKCLVSNVDATSPHPSPPSAEVPSSTRKSPRIKLMN